MLTMIITVSTTFPNRLYNLQALITPLLFSQLAGPSKSHLVTEFPLWEYNINGGLWYFCFVPTFLHLYPQSLPGLSHLCALPLTVPGWRYVD